MRPYLLRGVPHARRPSPLPPDFRSPEHAAETLGRLLAHPRFYSAVAELDGRVVGSNLLDAIHEGGASAVEHGGRITGYTTGIAFFAHSVGETSEDLKALIAAAREFGGPGFLLPARNAELYRWSLAHGLKVVQVMTLMSL